MALHRQRLAKRSHHHAASRRRVGQRHPTRVELVAVLLWPHVPERLLGYRARPLAHTRARLSVGVRFMHTKPVPAHGTRNITRERHLHPNTEWTGLRAHVHRPGGRARLGKDAAAGEGRGYEKERASFEALLAAQPHRRAVAHGRTRCLPVGAFQAEELRSSRRHRTKLALTRLLGDQLARPNLEVPVRSSN
eukprot:5226287-Pleurochrysis_carterae.AAC.1